MLTGESLPAESEPSLSRKIIYLRETTKYGLHGNGWSVNGRDGVWSVATETRRSWGIAAEVKEAEDPGPSAAEVP